MSDAQQIKLDREQWSREGNPFLDHILAVTGGRILAGWNTIEGIEFDIDERGYAHKRAVWGDTLVKNSDEVWQVEPYGPNAFRDAVSK